MQAGRNTYCHVYVWLQTKFGLIIRFIDLLYTRLVSTSNYSATANFHNSQITTATAKPFTSLLCLRSRSLATASNSGHSSASRDQVLSSQPPLQKSTTLTNKSQSYVTTDGQSASLSWCQAPIWGVRPDLYYCHTVADLLMWGDLFMTRERAYRLNCCWSSPAQSFLGPSPAGLVTLTTKVKVKVMLRPTVQSASPSWNKAPIWGALSLTKGRVCHLPDLAVISLLSVCTICILQVIKCMYIQHIQGLCQFRLSIADHALLLVLTTNFVPGL
jgi:hypothetical protein